MPSLDRYVLENLASRGGVRGSIRAWSIEYGHRDAPVSVTYQLQRNRYCEIVGRSHKSNNVFWTVDLTSWTCLQGCHDPECFGRGSPVPIRSSGTGSGTGSEPSSPTLETIRDEYEAWQDEEFEKALVELNLDDMVAKPAPTTGDSGELRSGSGGVTATDALDEPTPDDDVDEDLSDEALLRAIVDNPELFP